MRKIKAGRRPLVWTVSAVLLALSLAAIGLEMGYYGLPEVPASSDANSPIAPADSLILLAGGYDSNTYAATATAELYDLATRQFSATGTMTAARVNHTATLLKNGKVLIAGGAANNDPLREGGILNSSELYDPATGAFRATGSMNFERVGHTATLLPDGQVLVVGGFANNGDAVATAELYDPVSGTFAKAAKLTDPRDSPTATLLANNDLLIAGGEVLIYGGPNKDVANVVHDRLNTAELYNPLTAAFSCIGGVSFLGALCNQSMASRRLYHTATLLRDGRVLVAGGDSNCLNYTGSAQLYDPKLGVFVPANDMVADRQQHTATIMSDGQVLLAGGLSSCATLPPVVDAEIYDPAPAVAGVYTGAFTTTGTITEPRALHTAVLLPSGPDAGSVLLAGGSLSGNATAELYVPSAGSFACVGGVSPAPPLCNPSMTEARQGHTATLLAVPPSARSSGH